MSDIDAVQAYRTALRSTYVSRDGDECGRTYNLVDEDAADAAIAALEAERDAARSAQKKAQRRADQIEAAMNDAIKHPNRKFSHAAEAGYKLAQRDLDELDAELERLKVCGSCEHCNPKGPWCREAGNLWNFEAAEAGWDWLLTDGSIDDRVGLHFKCHFTPSRWTEATGLEKHNEWVAEKRGSCDSYDPEPKEEK